MKENEENPEEIKENDNNKENNKEIEKNKEINETEKNFIICYDKTIIEISDKKWSRFLIPYKNILEYKLKILKDKESNTYDPKEKMTLVDMNQKQCPIVCSIIEELNENNLTYHWLQIPDINNKLIVVKKEHLLKQKMKDEEVEILDYNSKKYKINPGKVCRLAKKYHTTKGQGENNILYLIKDISNEPHFVTKTIIQFAKQKRALNDENQTMEITEHNNQIIKVNCDSIRDLEDFNPYSEWCEINDINKNKIIVKKVNLLDCKELYDKNIEKNEIQKINDWKYDIYEININSEYSRVFPNRYKYYKEINKYEEFVEVDDFNKNKILIKTNLIEHYLDENINELSLYEEIIDKNNNKQIINPNDIIKNILLSFDDVSDSNGPYIELITQSGSKHIIKINTIKKILKLGENKGDKNNNKVSIKDNNGIKILTSLNKIKEINFYDNNIILLGFKDINENICYFQKKNILNKIKEIFLNLLEEDYLTLNDINGIERLIKYSQIRIINNKLKRCDSNISK